MDEELAADLLNREALFSPITALSIVFPGVHQLCENPHLMLGQKFRKNILYLHHGWLGAQTCPVYDGFPQPQIVVI